MNHALVFIASVANRILLFLLFIKKKNNHTCTFIILLSQFEAEKNKPFMLPKYFAP